MAAEISDGNTTTTTTTNTTTTNNTNKKKNTRTTNTNANSTITTRDDTRGWNKPTGGTSLHYNPEDGSYQLCGRITHEAPNGSMRRTMTLDCGNGSGGAGGGGKNEQQKQTVLLHLDAESYPGTAPWMTIKHARKLIVPGVCLNVTAVPLLGKDQDQDQDQEDNNDQTLTSSPSSSPPLLQLNATSIVIESVLPATPYLARLLSFPLESLVQLFSVSSSTSTFSSPSSLGEGVQPQPQPQQAQGPNDNSVPIKIKMPPRLVSALRPCDAVLCEKLWRLCTTERIAGRTATVFKRPELSELCNRIKEFQNWTRALTTRMPPPTKRFAWQSLERLEAQWCREIVDGPVEEYGSLTDDHNNNDKESRNPSPLLLPLSSSSPALEAGEPQNRLVFDNIDVDPDLNLPDPNDQRRVQYVNERKRPQIQWMLRLVLRLLDLEYLQTIPDSSSSSSKSAPPVTNTPRHVYLVDIGGGRGDLAMTIAAFLAQFPKHVVPHVTVIDLNEPSLRAGESRASQVGLQDYMSFALCDVSDDSQITHFLQQGNKHSSPSSSSYDLFFGLHCCGGLSEAAVELALRARARFCISTCCFRSNPSLASLTKLSESMVLNRTSIEVTTITTIPSTKDDSNEATTTTTTSTEESYQEDLKRVSILATGASTGGQHRAIRALNAIRLVAAEKRYQELHSRHNNGSNNGSSSKSSRPPHFRVWQESFPIDYSVQNRVLVGAFS